MMKSWGLGLGLVFWGLSLGVCGPRVSADSTGPLVVLTVTGVIDPITAEYVRESFDRARRESAGAVLVRLDTPGGLLDATREIVQEFLNAPFPVVVYVGPRGARAASAGLFLTLAGDVAAMAPETHLGAAHPVSIEGGGSGSRKKDDPAVSPEEEKAVSDTAAYARSLALSKQRNADWAEKAVRESLSLTSEEALKQKVIDLVAENETDLWLQVNGRKITKSDRVLSLNGVSSPRVEWPLSSVKRWLKVLAHPNVAYLLLILGFYALIYEFSTPGVGFGGVVGVMSLILAFFALQILPFNYVGLALIVAGLLLMAADAVVGGHGLLVVGGALALALGGFFLFDPSEVYGRVSWPLIGGTVASSLGFAFIVIAKIWQARRRRPLTGQEGLIGLEGEMRQEGFAYISGELWSVRCADPLRPGDRVRVREVQGQILLVERLSTPSYTGQV